MNRQAGQRPTNLVLPWLWAIAFGFLLTGCISPVLAADPPPPTPIPPPPTPRCTIGWAWQDSRLVLTKVHPYWKDGLAVGDIVLRINGQTAPNAIQVAELLFAGIPDPAQRRGMALDYLLMANQTLRLQVQHRGQSPYFFHLNPDCQI